MYGCMDTTVYIKVCGCVFALDVCSFRVGVVMVDGCGHGGWVWSCKMGVVMVGGWVLNELTDSSIFLLRVRMRVRALSA